MMNDRNDRLERATGKIPGGNFQEMINRHLPMIERQCFSAVRKRLKNHGISDNPVQIENEALELSNLVLDTLQQDNYRVLKQFKGNSRLSTYITTIIARQAVDMVRKKLGRNREKERAQAFGELGLWIYDQINGTPDYSANEIHDLWKKEKGNPPSLEQFETIIAKIKNKTGGPGFTPLNGTAVKQGITVPGDRPGEFIVKDNGGNPEDLLEQKEKHKRVKDIFKEVIEHLDGEERMVLRMRFPVSEDQSPVKVGQIAVLLKIKPKAVYKRIEKIMNKCRKLLKQKGVTINDLF